MLRVSLWIYLAGVAIVSLGLLGCTGQEASSPLQLEVETPPRVGEPFWVRVNLHDPATDDFNPVGVRFTLHYNNAFVTLAGHEAGPIVQSDGDGYRVGHYPANAEVAVSLSLDSSRSEGASAGYLARLQFRATAASSEEAPPYIALTDVEVLDATGTARRLEQGPSARLAIASSPGQETAPTLQVGHQHAVQNVVTVRHVSTPESGWVVIRGEEADGTRPVIGQARIEPGSHRNLQIPIDENFGLKEKQFAILEATLHRDTEASNTLDVSTARATDPPMQQGDEAVTTTFFASYTEAPPESRIIVHNQRMKDRTLVIDSIVASEPADVVIHRNNGNRPFVPNIIGKAEVGKGVNTNVSVALFDGETVICGETLWPMLHVRNESEDQPYTIDHPIVTKPVTILCE
jgi:hypothetical protein